MQKDICPVTRRNSQRPQKALLERLDAGGLDSDGTWQEKGVIRTVVLASWSIALIEYCFQVPANRFGYAHFSPPS